MACHLLGLNPVSQQMHFDGQLGHQIAIKSDLKQQQFAYEEIYAKTSSAKWGLFYFPQSEMLCGVAAYNHSAMRR